jgi:hypothetical protein
MSRHEAEVTESGGSGRGLFFGLIFLFSSVAIVVAIGVNYGVLIGLLSLWGVFIVGNLLVVRKPFKKRMVDLVGSSLVLMVLIAIELLRSRGSS